MQEISAWFLVISVMVLFFAIVMNMYRELFRNMVPVADEDIHTSDDIISNRILDSSKKTKKSNISLKTTKSRIQAKENTKKNIKNKLNTQKTSKTYQNKYTSYREYKKYNTVSR